METMETLTKEELEAQKKRLLAQYHAKKEEQLFADNSVDEAWIREEMEHLRSAIKSCSARIAAMETTENR